MKLYKHVRGKRIEDLVNKTIRFSQTGAFNDPFEVEPFISFKPSTTINGQAIIEELTKFASQIGLTEFSVTYLTDKLLDYINEKILGNLTNKKDIGLYLAKWIESQIGILSLSENNDNPLMWGHYTDDHTGFLIEFDTDKVFFTDKHELSPNSTFGTFRQVDYRLVRPDRDLSKMSQTELFNVKSLDWSYEKEWRMLMPLTKGNKVLDKSNIAREFPKGFPVITFSFNPNAITGVILGCRASHSLTKDVNNLKNTSDYSHLDIKKAELDTKTFKIIIS